MCYLAGAGKSHFFIKGAGLALSILAISFSASADLYECKFNGYSVQPISDVKGAKPKIVPLESVSAPTKISGIIDLQVTPGLYSYCTWGNDGERVYQKTDSTLVVGGVDGKALFKTNVTGIAYTLAMYPQNNAFNAFFPSTTGSYVETANQGDNSELVKAVWWYARMEFYQLPSYAGVPASVTQIGPVAGNIGNIVVGNPWSSDESDHPRPLITIPDMAFNVPVEKPTCTLTAPKSVDLGEYDVSDVENDNTQKVSATVSGNCTNTRKITMKLTTSKTTGTDGSLLANTASSNAAKGVGVLLKWPDNSLAVPNSTNNYATKGNTIIPSFSESLTAQLVKSGTEKVTSGTFSAIGTLQITYE